MIAHGAQRWRSRIRNLKRKWRISWKNRAGPLTASLTAQRCTNTIHRVYVQGAAIMTRQPGPALHVLHAAEGTKSPIDFTEIQPDKTMMSFFNRGWKHWAESHQCSLGTPGTKRGADRGWEGL